MEVYDTIPVAENETIALVIVEASYIVLMVLGHVPHLDCSGGGSALPNASVAPSKMLPTQGKRAESLHKVATRNLCAAVEFWLNHVRYILSCTGELSGEQNLTP